MDDGKDDDVCMGWWPVGLTVTEGPFLLDALMHTFAPWRWYIQLCISYCGTMQQMKCKTHYTALIDCSTCRCAAIVKLSMRMKIVIDDDCWPLWNSIYKS